MKLRLRLLPDGAADVLRRLPRVTKRQIRYGLRRLVEDPLNPKGGLDVILLRSKASPRQIYRLRVGDFRVVFELTDREVLVATIFHRGDGYGWLERLDEESS